MSEQTLVMPDLSHGTHAFHHTLGSALAVLSAAGIPGSRISIRSGGFGYPARRIVGQSPEPGEPVSANTQIMLFVAGAGVFDRLPVAMWDRGREGTPGTDEIIGAFDDPLKKAENWLHEGARLFDLQPGRPEACARWISLFGLSPESWPVDIWRPLAILLPSLQATAGTERGIRLALRVLLNLPLFELRTRSQIVKIEDAHYTRLGSTATHLGIDAVVGDHMEDLAALVLTIGPVSLKVYRSFQNGSREKLLQSVLNLVTPLEQKKHLHWRVEDPARAPRLGLAETNSILGVNFHLGREGAPGFESAVAEGMR